MSRLPLTQRLLCPLCVCVSTHPQSSGRLASSSTSASLFHRLLQDVRGLLDHTPDRGREPLQSVTVDCHTHRYTVTLTPHFIVAVHVTQQPATHGALAADTSEAKEVQDDEDEDDV